MGFSWYGNQVKSALKSAKGEICEKWGVLGEAEYKSRIPVKTGEMRRHATHDVHNDNEGVSVGVTEEINYAIFVEEGTSKQPAQRILEGTLKDIIPKLENVAKEILNSKMGN
jgi:HK97 gp10 family phage protein